MIAEGHSMIGSGERSTSLVTLGLNGALTRAIMHYNMSAHPQGSVGPILWWNSRARFTSLDTAT